MDKKAEERLFDEIAAIRESINNINAHGCAKSPEHTELFHRVNILEIARAEGKGKVAMLMIIVGFWLSVISAWIGKHL